MTIESKLRRELIMRATETKTVNDLERRGCGRLAWAERTGVW